MSLACAASSKKNDIPVLLNKTAFRKLTKKPNIQLRCGREIEVSMGLRRGNFDSMIRRFNLLSDPV